MSRINPDVRTSVTPEPDGATRGRSDLHSLKGKIVSGVLWVAAAKVGSQAITWVITIFVVRLLTPQDYGLMGMAGLFTGFLLLFNEIGLGAAIIRNPDIKIDQVSDVRWAILSMNIVLFLMLQAFAPVITWYFREPAVASIVRVLGIGFILNGISSASMYMLSREMAFKKKSRAELIGNLGGGMATLALATTGFGVWSLVVGTLARQAITSVLYCFYAPLKIRWAFSFSNVRQFLNFGMKVTTAKVLWYASSNADFMIVGRMLGKTQLGFYSLAFQFSSAPIDKIVNIVAQVAFPSFSAVQHDEAMLRRYYLKMVGVVAWITFPMFLGLMVVADTGISLLLTPEWKPVVLPLQILCVVSCFRALETMNPPLVVAKDRPGIVVLNNFLQAVVLPCSFYVGSSYGLKGVAVAWMIAWPPLFAIITRQTLQLMDLGFGRYLAALKHPIIGSIVMVAGVVFIEKQVISELSLAYRLAAMCGFGGAVYLTYNMLFNENAITEAMDVLRPRKKQASQATVALRPTKEASLAEAK